MAKSVKSSPNAEVIDAEGFVEASPIEGGFSLTEKRPIWKHEGGVAIRGLLLGTVELPSTQPNQASWRCYAIQLTAKTKVYDSADGEEIERIAESGEIVLLTATSVMQRLEGAARSKIRVFEVFVKPNGVQKSVKTPGGKVNLFEIVVKDAGPRTAANTLPDSLPRVALPQTSGDASDVPF